jgi:hypothetical protein
MPGGVFFMNRVLAYFLLILSFSLSAFSFAEGENVDSALGAADAAAMASIAKDQASQNAADLNKQADKFESSRANNQSLANQYFANGDVVNGNAALARAKQDAKLRDDARKKANDETEQADAFSDSEGDDLVSQAARQLNDSSSDADIERVVRSITGEQGGNVPVDNPTSDGVHFVCDGGQCRMVDGNAAMQNAYTKWKTADPDDTYKVRSVGEIVEQLKNVPDGEPITIAGHGSEYGLVLDSDRETTLRPGTPEYNQLAQALKGHPVTFESCSLANVSGFCSGIADQTGASVTAYDKTMYMGTDHTYAKDPNTSEQTWQTQGSPLQPGEVVANSLETNGSNFSPQTQSYTTPQFYIPTMPITVGSAAVAGSELGASLPFILSSALGALSAGVPMASQASANPTPNSVVPSSNPVPLSQSQPIPQSNTDVGLSNLLNEARAVAGLTNSNNSLSNEVQVTNSLLGFIRSQTPQPVPPTANSPSQTSSNQDNLNAGGTLVVKTPQTLAQQIAQMNPTGSLSFLLK